MEKDKPFKIEIKEEYFNKSFIDLFINKDNEYVYPVKFKKSKHGK